MFDRPWQDKTNTDPTRRLFPIPQNVINASSGIEGYLEQNRGYSVYLEWSFTMCK